MALFTFQGLVRGGRVSPQRLGHQGPRLVVDQSTIRHLDDSGLQVCPLEDVFTEPSNPVIVFGKPNVALILPNEAGNGWDRFAAFMFWRQKSYFTPTKGRVQAGVFYELLNLSEDARKALLEALQTLVGTRKVSCAHSVALALHRAGFTAGSRSLRLVYRPSKLASILWTEQLRYKGRPVELRIIQTGKSVHDQFISVWKREWMSLVRLYYKYIRRQAHGRAPVFEQSLHALPMSRTAWDVQGPTTRIGVSRPSHLGVNLGYLLGEQPQFEAELPGELADSRLEQPLQAFPGVLNRVTKLKKYVLFSPPVIRLMRHNLAITTDWMEAPTSAIAAMLRRSRGPERQDAYVYNFILTGTSLRIKRLLNDNGNDRKIVNWLLAKHVLLSGYSSDLRLAGELWCVENPDSTVTIYLSGESGTYKPEPERAEAAVEILSEMFQTKIVLVPRATE